MLRTSPKSSAYARLVPPRSASSRWHGDHAKLWTPLESPFKGVGAPPASDMCLYGSRALRACPPPPRGPHPKRVNYIYRDLSRLSKPSPSFDDTDLVRLLHGG